MTKRNPAQNTKQKILYAIMELVAEFPVKKITLSQVAERAGITKPAIFRHFLNKDALFEAAKADFFYTLAQTIQEVEAQTGNLRCSKSYDKIIQFFVENKVYLSFLLQMLVHAENAEELFEQEFKTAGFPIPCKPKMADSPNGPVIADKQAYYRGTYMGVSTLYFMGQYAFHDGANFIPPAEFGSRLRRFAERPVAGFVAIDSERLNELLGSFSFSFPEESPTSKFFKALCLAVKGRGLSNVNVDDVAKASGLAKSSLYSHFASKDDMIRQLILNEYECMIGSLEKNYSLAKTNTEAMAAYMYSLTMYIREKIYSLDLFAYLRHGEGQIQAVTQTLEKIESCPFIEGIDLEQLGIPLTKVKFFDWISSLVISLICQGRTYKFTTEDYFGGIKYMVGAIAGIKE